MSEADIYRRSREALTELYSTLTDAQLAVRVSETPAWTVKEVLCHVVGGAEDHVRGDNADAPSEAWTARHVARLSTEPVAAVLAIWDEIGPALEAFIAEDPRKWTFSPHDVWCHEHDVRAALGLPRRDDPEAIRFSASAVWFVRSRCTKAGLPVPEYVVGDEVVLEGTGGPTVRFPDLHEVGRVVFGRRSEAQIRALDWSADPEPYLPHLSYFEFQPSDAHG